VLTHSPDCVQTAAGTVASQPASEVSGGIWQASTGKPAGPTYQDEPAAWQCAPGCPVPVLDGQSGQSTSTGGSRGTSGTGWGMGAQQDVKPGKGDTGGASRFFHQSEWDPEFDAPFFYCAKPGKKERNAGVPDGMAGHPTVKPVTLIRYLTALITPPGGTVLDPFLGSGTTAVAATLGGFDCIGCELTDEYFPIIEARVAHAEKTVSEAPLALFDADEAL